MSRIAQNLFVRSAVVLVLAGVVTTVGCSKKKPTLISEPARNEVTQNGAPVSNTLMEGGPGSINGGSVVGAPVKSPAGKEPKIASGAPAQPVVPKGPECFTRNYRHKPTAGHDSGEMCSTHRNLIRIEHAGVSLASVCVRVNGTPTRFQPVEKKDKTLSGVIVGPIAGPKSVISVRYCVGKSRCPENCAIPKDEFMDAIGADEESAGKPMKVVSWDPADSSADTDVAAEIEAQLKNELGDASDLTLFQDWLADAESPVCGAKTAQAEKGLK